MSIIIIILNAFKMASESKLLSTVLPASYPCHLAAAVYPTAYTLSKSGFPVTIFGTVDREGQGPNRRQCSDPHIQDKDKVVSFTYSMNDDQLPLRMVCV